MPRDTELPVYGRAVPGQTVKVALGGQQATARADETGRWEAKLEPLTAGGPHVLSVSTAGKQLMRRNIMIGDIWLAAGEGNMAMPVGQAVEAVRTIAASHLQKMRFFTVPHCGSLAEEEECEARWEECNPHTSGAFSALAYHFGKTLLDALETPIGLIHASWSGTSAAAWTSADFLKGRPELGSIIRPLGRVRQLIEPEPEAAHEDTGNDGEARGWARPDFTDAGQSELMLPTIWQRHNLAFNGAVWFRRAFEIPASWAGSAVRLELGAIDDFDTTYFNGAVIGATGPEKPDANRLPRSYLLPGILVRPGRSVIAVRVFDRGGEGGFVGPASAMRVFPDGRPDEAISLAGPWRMLVERRIPLAGAAAPKSDDVMPASQYPSGLYNGMIAPLTQFPIRGVIWCQGESDVDRGPAYRTLFTSLIQSWRAGWGRGDFPFLFVQLANFMQRRAQPGDDAWADLREAQALALRLPATGMAVSADLGEAESMLPRQKRPLAERLALAALSIAYGRTMPHAGPIYANHAVEKGAVRLRFKNATGALRARNGKLEGFAIAGADRQFRWGEARIEGDAIVVSHPAIVAPIAVRYAWEANPPLSLEDAAGLPAAPFRTDDWPSATGMR